MTIFEQVGSWKEKKTELHTKAYTIQINSKQMYIHISHTSLNILRWSLRCGPLLLPFLFAIKIESLQKKNIFNKLSGNHPARTPFRSWKGALDRHCSKRHRMVAMPFPGKDFSKMQACMHATENFKRTCVSSRWERSKTPSSRRILCSKRSQRIPGAKKCSFRRVCWRLGTR